MDNTLVVGVGNIYANESLFRAGIHPNRAANRISMARYAKLVHEVKNVLTSVREHIAETWHTAPDADVNKLVVRASLTEWANGEIKQQQYPCVACDK